jgi:hypothetical protein
VDSANQLRLSFGSAIPLVFPIINLTYNSMKNILPLILTGLPVVLLIFIVRNNSGEANGSKAPLLNKNKGEPIINLTSPSELAVRQKTSVFDKINVPEDPPIMGELDHQLKQLAEFTDPNEMARLDLARRTPLYKGLFNKWNLSEVDSEIVMALISDRELLLAKLRVDAFKVGFGGALKMAPQMREVSRNYNKKIQAFLGNERASEVFSIDDTFWKLPD